MTISKQMNGTTLTLAPEGRLDTMTSPELEKELNASLEGADRLILDFSRLVYISSAGLRVLLSTHKKMISAGGSLTIANAVSAVREVFDITGFSDILTLA